MIGSNPPVCQPGAAEGSRVGSLGLILTAIKDCLELGLIPSGEVVAVKHVRTVREHMSASLWTLLKSNLVKILNNFPHSPALWHRDESLASWQGVRRGSQTQSTRYQGLYRDVKSSLNTKRIEYYQLWRFTEPVFYYFTQPHIPWQQCNWYITSLYVVCHLHIARSVFGSV